MMQTTAAINRVVARNGIDRTGDAHRAELCGETGTDLGREGNAGDDRCQFTGVHDGGQQPGQRCQADQVQAAIGFDAHHHRCDGGHGEDYADGAAARQQGCVPEADFADVVCDVFGVSSDSEGNGCDRLGVERHVTAELGEYARRSSASMPQTMKVVRDHQYVPTAGTTTAYNWDSTVLTTNTITNANTTASLTASATPLGPPLALSPL